MRSPASVFRGQVRFNFHNSSPCSGRREQQGGGRGVGARRSGRGVRELRWPAWRIRSGRRCGAGAGQRRPPRRSRHGQRRRSARGAGHAGASGRSSPSSPNPKSAKRTHEADAQDEEDSELYKQLRLEAFNQSCRLDFHPFALLWHAECMLLWHLFNSILRLDFCELLWVRYGFSSWNCFVWVLVDCCSGRSDPRRCKTLP